MRRSFPDTTLSDPLLVQLDLGGSYLYMMKHEYLLARQRLLLAKGKDVYRELTGRH